MSFVHIFSFDSSGFAHKAGEVRNSWLGAMAIWRIMEFRYLPPYRPDDLLKESWYRPEMTDDDIRRICGYLPTRVIPSFNLSGSSADPIQAIWSLADDPSVPLSDRIVLSTTFDNCLVRKCNIRRVIEAMQEFEREEDKWETNLSEQVSILQSILADPDIIAVGWNQTSVNADDWETKGEYDEASGTCAPYNCLTGNKHFWLFDDFKEKEKE